MRKLLLIALLVWVALPASAQVLAITHAEIHPVSGPAIEDGTIIVRGAKIEAVGRDLEIPPEARIIDATGKIVTPGFIDSASGIGLSEIGLSAEGTVDGSTSEEDLGASFNPIWAVNPENTRIPITRLRGVTAALVRPGGSNLFTGQGSVLALDGETVPDMIRKESVAVYAAMGEAGSSRAGGSRAANYRRLVDALTDARDRSSDASEDDDSEAKKRSDLNDADLDILESVVSGDRVLVVSANRVSDLRLAAGLKAEFGLRLVIAGGTEAWRVADELARAQIPIIVSVSSNLPRFDGLSATLENAGRLRDAGAEVLLTGGRGMAHEAGLAVANGMDHEAALRALTLAPAEVWGVSDSMGSLDPGKSADLVVWSGDPFELSTSAEHVFIGGREIPEDSRQERLFDRYRDLDRYRRIGGGR